MKTSTLITLSRRLDKTLTHFALAANSAGEYPWQTAQREKRQRTAVGVAGSVAVGGGLLYGANKAGAALKKRYGVGSVKDGAIMGAAEGVQKARAAVAPMIGKAKDAAGAGMAKLKGAAAPAMDAAKRKLAAGKLSYGRGVAQKQGAGKLIARVGRALIHAARADTLVELEAKLDGALQQFAKA